MSEMHGQPPRTPETPESRDVRNLRIVARHLARGGATAPTPAAQAAGTQAAGSEAGTHPRSRPNRGWKRWGPLGVAAGFILGKLKLLLPLIKFAKLGTLVTMLVALWVYAQIWGFAFALGFILLIFVHEMGHALVMRQQGIRTGAPVFIPFVGAVIAMKEMPKNAYVESLVALGGPAVGTAGAFVCLLVGAATGSLFWYALASTGFLINLFNMIPLSPLDGGRIVGVISRWIWVVGYAVGIAVFLVTHSPILFLILLLGLFGLGRTLRGPRPGYYDVAPAARRFISLAYFGLLVIMVLGMWTADRPLAGLHAIR
jgi:Zn-dependent protease